MGRAPLLLPAAAIVFSIVAYANGLWLASFCLAAAVAIFRRDVAAGLLGGLLVGTLHGQPAVIEIERPTTRYIGTVVGDVRSESGVRSFPFAVDGIGTLHGTSREPVATGERLIVRARISPLDEARNPGEPSPRALALDEGVIGEIVLRRIVERHEPDLRDPRIWAAVARDHGSQTIRSLVPEPQATILTGALWGERGTLARDVRDDFQATGTVHVLVTAGLHLGVIAGLCGGLLTAARVPRVAAALATIPIVFAYAWLSGWHLPSERAAIMISLGLVARACGARTFSLNTLALAAIVVACVWPVAVRSVSFALSFSCVASIVLFAEPIAEWLRAMRAPRPIAEALGLTVSTQIGVWPLTAAVFFSVAPYAILANAIVVPLVGVTMVLGLAILATHSLPALCAIIVRYDTWLLSIVLLATHTIALLPGARLTISPPPVWAIVAYDAAIVAAALLVRARPAIAAIVVATGCLGVAGSAAYHPTSGLRITMLDVGQADAIVIRTPHGRTILIDTGGRLERGPAIDGKSPAERSAERVVIPYMQRAGIAAVDLIVLTHPHGDHVGGCLGIVTQFRVREIFDSGQSYNGRAYADCRRAAAERRVPIRVARRGLRWTSGDGVSLDILAPTEVPLVDTGDDVNENSIVARLTYTRDGPPFTALFMGDAGMAREAELIDHRIDLRANFLKVGHHGSAYASTPAFINAVKPPIAAISVGRHNLFGHPASATIDALRHAGSTVFRTDRSGAVTMSIDGSGLLKANTMISGGSVNPLSH